MISANHDKVEGHSVNGEILVKGFRLYYKVSNQRMRRKQNHRSMYNELGQVDIKVSESIESTF